MVFQSIYLIDEKHPLNPINYYGFYKVNDRTAIVMVQSIKRIKYWLVKIF